MENTQRSRGYFGPILLIGLGIIFLLSTLGYLHLSIWQLMLRLWPVFIIAAGLDFLLGRKPAWGLLITLCVVMLIISAVAWGIESWSPIVWDEDWHESGELYANTAITQEIGAATSAEVAIEAGAGDLELQALAGTSTLLLDGTIARGRMSKTYTVSGHTGYLDLRAQRVRGDWSLRLNPALPIRLKVQTGAGRTDLSLAGLNLTDLEVNNGVGQTVLELPAKESFQANVNNGAGEIRIYVPKGMAVRIRINQGIGSIDVPAGFERLSDTSGRVYASPGYETARNRIDLTIHNGVGSITVIEK